MDVVDKIIDQILATGNLPAIILLGCCIYLARQLSKERESRDAADKADREFAKSHTDALYAVATTLSEIKGVLSNGSRK